MLRFINLYKQFYFTFYHLFFVILNPFSQIFMVIIQGFINDSLLLLFGKFFKLGIERLIREQYNTPITILEPVFSGVAALLLQTLQPLVFCQVTPIYQ